MRASRKTLPSKLRIRSPGGQGARKAVEEAIQHKLCSKDIRRTYAIGLVT